MNTLPDLKSLLLHYEDAKSRTVPTVWAPNRGRHLVGAAARTSEPAGLDRSWVGGAAPAWSTWAGRLRKRLGRRDPSAAHLCLLRVVKRGEAEGKQEEGRPGG